MHPLQGPAVPFLTAEMVDRDDAVQRPRGMYARRLVHRKRSRPTQHERTRRFGREPLQDLIDGGGGIGHSAHCASSPVTPPRHAASTKRPYWGCAAKKKSRATEPGSCSAFVPGGVDYRALMSTTRVVAVRPACVSLRK